MLILCRTCDGQPKNRGSIPGSGKNCTSPPFPDWLKGPSSLIFNGYREIFFGRKADHSLQSSDQVKNVWSHTSIPPWWDA